MTKPIVRLFLAGLLATAWLSAGDAPKPQAKPKSQASGAGGLTVKGGRVRVISVSRGSSFKSGGFAYAPAEMKEGDEVLAVVGRIVSGKPSEDDLVPWLTDKSGAKVSEKPTTLSKDDERTWVFKVPVSVAAVILRFPGGASLPLASFLKKTP